MDILSFFKKRKLELEPAPTTPKASLIEAVICPVCRADITNLFFNKRNEHVETCLMGPIDEDDDKWKSNDEVPLEATKKVKSPRKRSSTKKMMVSQVSKKVEFIEESTQDNPILISDDEKDEAKIALSITENTATSIEIRKDDPINEEIPSQYSEDEEIMIIEEATTQSPKKISKKKSKTKKQVKPRKPPKPKPVPPSFKTLSFPGLKELIMVDGFQFAHPDVNKFFLSHFHSDHYVGLNKSFTDTIFCSEITANLLESNMNFDRQFIFSMNLKDKYEILPNLFVKLIDANHCPGAVLFLFEYFEGDKLLKRILHTGDFRFCYAHYQLLKDMHIDEIYLDTTYFIINRGMFYLHPIQKNIIRQTCEDIKDVTARLNKTTILKFFNKSDEKFVIVIGIYSIGKENLFLNLAKSLNLTIYTLKRHYKTLSHYLRSLEGIETYTDINEIKDPKFILLTPLRHVRDLKFTNLNYKIIKIQPTGWSGRLFIPKEVTNPRDKLEFITQIENKRPNLQYNAKVVQLPYSEHSNLKELILLLNKLKYNKIIPTVSVDNHKDYNLIPDIQKLVITEEDVEKYFEIDKPEINDFYIS